MVHEALLAKGWSCVLIYWARNGALSILESSPQKYSADHLAKSRQGVTVTLSVLPGRMELAPEGSGPPIIVDVVYSLLMGYPGEDGSLQATCRLMSIPAIGATPECSVVTLDKAYAKDILKAHDIPIVEYRLIRAADIERQIASLGSGPYVVKPRRQGSSVGVSYVRASDLRELKTALAEASSYCGDCLVEPYLQSTELHCYAFRHGHGTAVSRVSGTKPSSFIYSHDEKLNSPLSVQRFVQEDLSPQTVNAVKDSSRQIYDIFDGGGLMRIDFFMYQGALLFNEANTVPTGYGPVTGANPWLDQGWSIKEVVDQILRFQLKIQ